MFIQNSQKRSAMIITFDRHQLVCYRHITMFTCSHSRSPVTFNSSCKMLIAKHMMSARTVVKQYRVELPGALGQYFHVPFPCKYPRRAVHGSYCCVITIYAIGN